MTEQTAPPEGVTLDGASGPPPGVTLDQPPAGVTLDAQPHDSPPSMLDRAIDTVSGFTGPYGGFAKGAVDTAAGLVDMANRPVLPLAGTEKQQVLSPNVKKATDWVRQRAKSKTVADVLGKFMEAGGELAAAPELLPESEIFKGFGELSKVMEKYPTISGILHTVMGGAKTAARAGSEGGAQTFVKSGGNVEETKSAAIGSALFGGALGTLTHGASEAAKLLRPGVEAMEGVEVPAMASAKAEPAAITKLARTASDTPKMQAKQSKAAGEVIRNGARRAVKTALQKVNETRAAIQGPPDEAGNYPGTYTFKVAPFGEEIEATDPNYVQKLLNEARDAQEHEGFSQLGPRQQARVNNTVDSLEQQLDQYHTDQATRPRFLPINEEAAVANTEDYRTAGDILQNSIDDVYQRMRGAANEQLDKKWLKQLTPSDFSKLLEQNADKFSAADRQIATDTYRKGVALKAYHNAIQKAFNISPAQEAAAKDIGAKRVFGGKDSVANALDEVLSEHGDDLRELVGDEGIRSVRRLNQLVKSPETAGRFNDMLRYVAMHARRHYGSIGGLLGSAIGHQVGAGPYVGGAVGVATGMAMQKAINAAATNPAIADRLIYAVENNIPKTVAAPLITSMIVKADKEKEKPDAGSN